MANVALPLTIKSRRFIEVRSSGKVINFIHDEKPLPLRNAEGDRSRIEHCEGLTDIFERNPFSLRRSSFLSLDSGPRVAVFQRYMVA